MKRVQVPTNIIRQSFELTDEEKKEQAEFKRYCEQYMNDKYTFKRFIKEKNEALPNAFIYTDENGYEVMQTTPYGVKRNILSEMERNNILELQRVQEYSFDNYETNETWQKNFKQNAINYADNFNGNDWFMVSGITGSGKSHICTSLVFRLASEGIWSRYISWVDFKNVLKSDLNNSAHKIHVIKKSPVLYIDDFLKVGRQGGEPSDYDLEVATEIIWYRYENNLPTIISSEYDLKKIGTMNNAVSGRINQKAGKYVNRIGDDAKRNWREKR